jgi:hypothetical protein
MNMELVHEIVVLRAYMARSVRYFFVLFHLPSSIDRINQLLTTLTMLLGRL